MKSLYRSIYSKWDGLHHACGIAPTKVRPTKFIDCSLFPEHRKYWRDIPSKRSMTERLNAFLEPRSVSVNYEAFDLAVDIVRKQWQKHYGTENTVLSLIDSVGRLPSSTSAGLPYLSGVKKGDVRRQLLRAAASQWRRVSLGQTLKVFPCRSGARRQLREVGKNKPRLIWAYPGYLSVLENQFVGALQDTAPPRYMGWSINWLDNGRSLERVARNSGKGWNAILQLDFSSFDSTIPSFLIQAAFDIIRSLFNLSRIERIMLYQLEYYFIHTPLAFYGDIIQKHRGIPSGSTFTQLVGSICNMIMCCYCDKAGWYSLGLNMEDSCWLGDDSLLIFREGLAIEEVRDRFIKYFSDFGVEVNSEKSNYVVNNCWMSDGYTFINKFSIKFLGRCICPDLLDFKLSFSKFDAQVMWPESEDKTAHDAGTRLIGLVWAYGMYFDTYTKLSVAYHRLNLENNEVNTELVTRQTNRDTSRFIELFVGNSEVSRTSFPSFYEVSDRYFDNVHISKSYRTKNADITCPRLT